MDEENEKNEQYEMNLNDNNKIIITPITTNENINTVNNKNGNFNLDIKDNLKMNFKQKSYWLLILKLIKVIFCIYIIILM